MRSVLVSYVRLRLQVLRNLLLRSGLPPYLIVLIAMPVLFTAMQFAMLLGRVVSDAHRISPQTFPYSLTALYLAFQLVLSFVVLGSVSIRLFDPRKVAEVDTFASLPLRRFDRFAIQASEVVLVPTAMVFAAIVPAMFVAGSRAGFSTATTAVLVTGAAASALLPVPTVIAVSAFLLRATPGWLFRRRIALFAVLALGVAPIVPLLTTLLDSWRQGRPTSPWLPASWAALAVDAAERGDVSGAALRLGATLALLAVASFAAFVAYDRVFLERFDEVLAKLSIPPIPEDADVVSGRKRSGGVLAMIVGSRNRAWGALLRKEILGYSRDPALQFTFFALGASAFTFALLAGQALGAMASGGIAFLSVYLAASLGLASFSQEGRGLPVLAPLPIAVDAVLSAKLAVNTGMLAIAGAGGCAVFAFTLPPNPAHKFAILLPAAIIGAVSAAPLGALVTAMGALFPRRLLRTGRREISILAMSFFSALALLFYASLVGSLAGPITMGPSFLWMPIGVLTAWIFVAAALVSAARKAVRRGRWDG